MGFSSNFVSTITLIEISLFGLTGCEGINLDYFRSFLATFIISHQAFSFVRIFLLYLEQKIWAREQREEKAQSHQKEYNFDVIERIC
jgi:hypothetical protein